MAYLPLVVYLATSVFLLSFNSSVQAQNDVLVLRGEAEEFQQIVEAIKADFDGELTFNEMLINKKSNISNVSDEIKRNQTKAVILLGNKAVNLYKKYQSSAAEAPPAIATAALFLDNGLKSMNNVTGIRYEIPVVTSIINLRSILTEAPVKVGVIYREWAEPQILLNNQYLSKEQVSLTAIQLPNNNFDKPRALRSKLRKLISEVDVLWLLNDNALLTKDLLVKVWIPELKKAQIPVVVGVKSLVATRLQIGSYAVIPDHVGLGLQTASLLEELWENEWKMSSSQKELEQPIAIIEYLNRAIFDKKSIKYQQEQLVTVDNVIE